MERYDLRNSKSRRAVCKLCCCISFIGKILLYKGRTSPHSVNFTANPNIILTIRSIHPSDPRRKKLSHLLLTTKVHRVNHKSWEFCIFLCKIVTIIAISSRVASRLENSFPFWYNFSLRLYFYSKGPEDANPFTLTSRASIDKKHLGWKAPSASKRPATFHIVAPSPDVYIIDPVVSSLALNSNATATLMFNLALFRLARRRRSPTRPILHRRRKCLPYHRRLRCGNLVRVVRWRPKVWSDSQQQSNYQ